MEISNTTVEECPVCKESSTLIYAVGPRSKSPNQLIDAATPGTFRFWVCNNSTTAFFHVQVE